VGAPTDLAGITDRLHAQLTAGGTISLDDTVLPGVDVTVIGTSFLLPPGTPLTVDGLAADAIPAAVGTTLTISGGTADVLGVAGVPVTLTFVDGTPVTYHVVATMPATWQIATSFPDLTMFPFSVLDLTDAEFAYSSDTGQTLAASIDLGPVAAVLTLLGLGAPTVRASGPFQPRTDQAIPVGTLTAPLGGTWSVGEKQLALTVDGAAVAVAIGEASDTDPIQPVDLILSATFQDTLTLGVTILPGGQAYAVSVTPLPAKGGVVSLIEALPGANGITGYIPSELTTIFDAIGLDAYTMLVTTTPAVTYLGVTVGTQSTWTLITDVLVLTGLALQVEVVDPQGIDWTRVTITAGADFLPHVFPGSFDFLVGLADSGGSWAVDTVSGGYYGVVTLGSIVAGLLGANQNTVPAVLTDIAFSNFGVSAVRSAPGQPFSYTCYGAAQAAFPLLDSQLSSTLSVTFSESAGGYDVQLAGGLVLGQQTFALTLDLSSTGGLLKATWQDAGTPLGLDDIATALGWTGLPPIPGDLDLALTSAGFSYDFATEALTVTATSARYGQFVLACVKSGSDRIWIVDLAVPLGIKLSDIPVAGEQIPPALDVGIDSLDVVYASAAADATTVTALNSALAALNAKPLTSAALDVGLAFAAAFDLGAENLVLGLPLEQSTSAAAAPGTALVPAAAPASTTAPAGKWFTVDKSFGPLTLSRIGLSYSDSVLLFAIDAGIAFGPLALSLQGLGFGSPIDAFKPVVALSGLALSYQQPPVEILGAILRLPDSELAPGIKDQFDGELVLRCENLSLAAIGSYARYTDGTTSLFVFAQLDAPLGGPPFFFVTGLMAGFGFNRSLTLPGQDQVASFPLLLLAAPPQPGQPAQDPMQLLAVLEGNAPLNGVTQVWIAPQPGSYWLAAGLQFTSFELLSTNAMLAVTFGHDLSFALLGLSTFELPQPVDNANPYAYVELMIRVVVQPTVGYVGASAILSPNSYVIAPAGHLTGGFAASFWFGDNPYAGQFVVTLGGYHPAFTPPSYFPQVPRLGFNWAVSNLVTIKGDAYFALTGSCVMAGGGLEVLFASGDLRAWYIVQADFLLSWHPFFYSIQVAISIGVSYRLNLLVCHKTITVSLGAKLTMWGPPTGGIVHIDLAVVSFSVRFGSTQAGGNTAALDWNHFGALLPATDQICTITITTGLYKSSADPSSASGQLWIVRAGQFGFQTSSAIPASKLAYGTPTAALSADVDPGIAIRPMNLTGVSSTHTLTVYAPGQTDPYDVSGWTLHAAQRAVPGSLWGAPPQPFTQIPATPSNEVLTGQTSGYTVSIPPPSLGSSAGPIALSTLGSEQLPAGTSPWVAAPASSSDFVPVAETDTVGLIRQAAALASQRSALCAALSAAGLFTGADGTLDLLAAGADRLFRSPPMEQPA
jgi:hypothetical protein